MRAIQAVRLFGREAQRTANWYNLLNDVANSDMQLQKLVIGFRTSSSVLSGIENLLVIYFGASMVMDGNLTVGMLMAFASYKATFSARIGTLVDHAVSLKMLNLHSERLADIALEPPEYEPHCDPEIAHLKPRIELVNVSFRYADIEPWILKGVNLILEPGESVALVGPSGCGKTTLLKILLGLIKPTAGEVRLDGVPIDRLGLSHYRHLIGSVMQDDVLLSGSIAENISFFDLAFDQNRITACATLASVHDDILKMPMGYRTLVGDMGTTLSGGQKQRILLARALYKQPRILALDEATSHLDGFREHLVNDALSKLDLTRIMIAHRVETVAKAGRVVILESGELRDARAASLRTDAVGKIEISCPIQSF